MIAEHRKLVENLLASGVLTANWRGAFDAVPRHLFVPDVIWSGDPLSPVTRQVDPQAWLNLVYTDDVVVTQVDDGAHGAGHPSSSTSAPSIVAMMLDRAEITEGQSVLEIGTGTGWNAGLLAARLGDQHVTTVEVDGEVGDHARRALAAAGFDPEVVQADGADGHPGNAPYDRVLATCAVHAVPHSWVRQTRPGGLLLTPWGTTYHNGALARLLVTPDRTAAGQFADEVAFMWIRDQRPAGHKGRHETGAQTESTTSLYPDVLLNDTDAAFAIGLRVPGCRWTVEPDADGDPHHFVLWFTDPRSCATLTVTPDSDRYAVHQHGPRMLWDEVVDAYNWWIGEGRPAHTRFGLSVTPERQWTWLDEPDHHVP